jgi:hypothetical protein
VQKDRRQASVSVPGDEVDLRKVPLEPLPASVAAGPGDCAVLHGHEVVGEQRRRRHGIGSEVSLALDTSRACSDVAVLSPWLVPYPEQP